MVQPNTDTYRERDLKGHIQSINRGFPLDAGI